MPTHTHTYAVLELSPAAYQEVRSKLEAAGYQFVFHRDDQFGETIDMHGIAVASEKKPAAEPVLDETFPANLRCDQCGTNETDPWRAGDRCPRGCGKGILVRVA